jgi:hypothetical protein
MSNAREWVSPFVDSGIIRELKHPKGEVTTVVIVFEGRKSKGIAAILEEWGPGKDTRFRKAAVDVLANGTYLSFRSLEPSICFGQGTNTHKVIKVDKGYYHGVQQQY